MQQKHFYLHQENKKVYDLTQFFQVLKNDFDGDFSNLGAFLDDLREDIAFLEDIDATTKKKTVKQLKRLKNSFKAVKSVTIYLLFD